MLFLHIPCLSKLFNKRSCSKGCLSRAFVRLRCANMKFHKWFTEFVTSVRLPLPRYVSRVGFLRKKKKGTVATFTGISAWPLKGLWQEESFYREPPTVRHTNYSCSSWRGKKEVIMNFCNPPTKTVWRYEICWIQVQGLGKPRQRVQSSPLNRTAHESPREKLTRAQNVTYYRYTVGEMLYLIILGIKIKDRKSRLNKRIASFFFFHFHCSNVTWRSKFMDISNTKCIHFMSCICTVSRLMLHHHDRNDLRAEQFSVSSRVSKACRKFVKEHCLFLWPVVWWSYTHHTHAAFVFPLLRDGNPWNRTSSQCTTSSELLYT